MTDNRLIKSKRIPRPFILILLLMGIGCFMLESMLEPQDGIRTSAFFDQSLNFSISDHEAEKNPSNRIAVIEVQGSIGPTVSNYLSRALETAKESGDQALVMKLDTPGGLLNVTQDIVQMMLASDLPIIVYVYPEGGNAGSAGTFITLAAHIAAMAPATSIGAASPVSMGGGQQDTVMQKKVFNYAESFIETVAERRGRNVEWAKSAVRDGASITANQALAKEVIDYLADDLKGLLEQIDGHEINGLRLETKDAEVYYIRPNLAEILFSILLRPEVLLILTLVAIYGILGEITNPGAIIPGVAGAISLILLLFGVAALPINVAGFLLIGLAIILFVMEAFTPTYGLLLGGGAIAFFLGAIMLFQDLPQDMQLSMGWIIPATLLTVLFFTFVVYYGLKAQFGARRSGMDMMVGKVVKAAEPIHQESGRIVYMGEYWNTRSEKPVKKGQKCIIVRISGLQLEVEPADEYEDF
ncbi:nodulation protein NfeD [Balneolaceae bacterium ANBcel3]|nr:nodulation protein NfeD [Balneolaceae bacterium ANBcel3]